MSSVNPSQSNYGPYYSLAISLLAQPQAGQVKKILKKITLDPTFPAWGVQVLERTFKSRGRMDLGQIAHQGFLKKLPGDRFIKISHEDAAGDAIFLKEDSASYRSWQLAKKRLQSDSELHGFARCLSRFVALEVDPDASAEHFRFLIRESEQYANVNLPFPPLLRMVKTLSPEEGLATSGNYDPRCDVISLQIYLTDPSVLAHEWGHFIMDQLDDDGVPNDSFLVVYRTPKSLLFDPYRCITYESVSRYGGLCDFDRQTEYPGTRKNDEDAAESFAHVLMKKRSGLFADYNDAHWKLWEGLLVQFEKRLIEHRNSTTSPMKLVALMNTAQEFHRIFGTDLPRPPEFRNQSTEIYTGALLKWVRNLNTKDLPLAKQRRREKLIWIDQLLQKLSRHEAKD